MTNSSPINNKLLTIKPQDGQKLFKAAEAAAAAASLDADHPLRLDKVGFARAVLDVVEDKDHAGLRDQTLGNFEVIFRRIDKAQRDALRENNRERISNVLNRLRKNFLKDHPKAATRRDIDEFLDNVINQLVDTSPEAETVRDAVRRIRAEFALTEEPFAHVDNYDSVVKALESLVYEPVRDVQDGRS